MMINVVKDGFCFFAQSEQLRLKVMLEVPSYRQIFGDRFISFILICQVLKHNF